MAPSLFPSLCPARGLRRRSTIRSGGWKQHTPHMRRPICLALKRRTPTWGCHSWSSSWRRSGWKHQKTLWTSDLPPTTQSEATALLPNFHLKTVCLLCSGDFHWKQFCLKVSSADESPIIAIRETISPEQIPSLEQEDGRFLLARSQLVVMSAHVASDGALQQLINWIPFFLSLIGRWMRQMFWE